MTFQMFLDVCQVLSQQVGTFRTYTIGSQWVVYTVGSSEILLIRCFSTILSNSRTLLRAASVIYLVRVIHV